MKSYLIDSDVLLDFFLDRPYFSNDAAIIIFEAEQRRLRLFVTPVILANVYYVFRKRYNDRAVKSAIKIIMPYFEILPISKNVVQEVLESDYRDFEDALPFKAAEQSGYIDAIITRNIEDYKTADLPVLLPKELVSMIQS